MKKIARALALVLTLALTCVAFVACAPKDVEAAKAKMTDAGYICAGIQDDDKEEGAVGGIFATKITETVTAVLYDSSADANAAYEKYLEKYKDDTKKNVKKSGKWIVIGTEAAIEAFLG